MDKETRTYLVEVDNEEQADKVFNMVNAIRLIYVGSIKEYEIHLEHELNDAYS